MDVKRSPTTTVSDQVKTTVKAQNFIADVKSEIGKISWPSQEELITYTKIVMGATLAFGIGVYCIDLLIQLTLTGLEFVVRAISG